MHVPKPEAALALAWLAESEVFRWGLGPVRYRRTAHEEAGGRPAGCLKSLKPPPN